MKKTKWIAIEENLDYKAFEEPIRGHNCKYWLEQRPTGESYTTRAGITYPFYEYNLYNSELEPTEAIFENEWNTRAFGKCRSKWILKIEDPDKEKHSFSSTQISIVDKNSEERKFNSDSLNYNAFLTGLALLKFLSKRHLISWSDYDSIGIARLARYLWNNKSNL